MSDRTSIDARFADRVDAQSAATMRGIISGLGPFGITVVIEPDADAREVSCDLLDAGVRPGEPLVVGDAVLVWLDRTANGRGIILGRIVAAQIEMTKAGPVAKAPPMMAITLEAEETLTLRVGDGSIEIRSDGRVLLKGTDVVSHAKRTNRIKGGSVSIN